jgi:putative PEP-CTERM system histidine kinase
MDIWLSGLAAGGCLLGAAAALWPRGRGWPGVALFVGMLLLAAERLIDLRLVAAPGDPARLLDSLRLKSVLPLVWLWFSLVYARANWRDFLYGWRWVLVAAAVVPMLVVAAEVLATGAAGGVHLAAAGKGWVLVVVVLNLGMVANLEKTFRASVGMGRWRIKYVVLGLAVIFGLKLYILSQVLVFAGYPPWLVRLESIGVILGCALLGLGQMRSATRRTDIYPSRTILQGSLTLVLAGAYFLGVGLLAHVAARLGGTESFPVQALVVLLGIVGLAVMLLSDRVRSSTRQIISRHFRRAEHDFRRIWTDFTRRTASVLDAAELGMNAAEVISASFNVLGVTVCRVAANRGGLDCLHSTAERASGEALGLGVQDFAAIARRQRPFPLEADQARWAVALRAWCPRKFAHGGPRLVVPLVSSEQLVGLVVLSDRVNGVAYSGEEIDLLKCIADQLAGGLLNCALSEEVLQARQLEAFQTVSAFFVHDLKNAANGLNLMLRNLPVHFEDAEFRADAMRGVGLTVARINQLIFKLSHLRDTEADAQGEAVRLDLLCAEVVVAEWPGDSRVECELEPVGWQELDAEAIKSVLRNLVGNALEAGAQRVRVGTRRQARGVLLVVSDDGCGMSAAFQRDFLFRAFHTTKASGLGVGMFQCRKIVTAHGGSIKVESAPGRGTRVAVFLPGRTNNNGGQQQPT